MSASRPASLLLPALLASLLLAACTRETAPPRAVVLSDSSAIQRDTTLSASLAQILRSQERFGVFSTLIDSAGLTPVLQHGGPYTVFAATSDGLEAMPQGLIDELLRPPNRERLRQIVAYHLHRGQLSPDSLRNVDSISTLAGRALSVSVDEGRMIIGKKHASTHAITGTNGRIFAFDALAMPPIGGTTVSLPTTTYDTLGSDSGTGQGASGSGNGSHGASGGNSGGSSSGGGGSGE